MIITQKTDDRNEILASFDRDLTDAEAKVAAQRKRIIAEQTLLIITKKLLGIKDGRHEQTS